MAYGTQLNPMVSYKTFLIISCITQRNVKLPSFLSDKQYNIKLCGSAVAQLTAEEYAIEG